MENSVAVSNQDSSQKSHRNTKRRKSLQGTFPNIITFLHLLQLMPVTSTWSLQWRGPTLLSNLSKLTEDTRWVRAGWMPICSCSCTRHTVAGELGGGHLCEKETTKIASDQPHGRRLKDILRHWKHWLWYYRATVTRRPMSCRQHVHVLAWLCEKSLENPEVCFNT